MSQEVPSLENQREELLTKTLVERIAALEYELAQYKVQCTIMDAELQQWRESDNNAKAQAKPSKSTT